MQVCGRLEKPYSALGALESKPRLPGSELGPWGSQQEKAGGWGECGHTQHHPLGNGDMVTDLVGLSETETGPQNWGQMQGAALGSG